MAKLKVYRTAIGFHDAYVAASNQKAALAAWGADANLFARGQAERVEDADLMAAPLARPGEVVRIARGSAAEHLRALPADAPARAKPRSGGGVDTADAPKRGRARTRPAPTRPAVAKRPSRAAVDAAQTALDTLERDHRAALAAARREEEALAERRRRLDAKHRAEASRLQDAFDRADATWRTAMAAWRSADDHTETNG